MEDFALVLLRKGPDRQRLVRAIMQINECSEATAVALASRSTPVTVNSSLTEAAAALGQFELICSDAVSIYLRSEILEENDEPYLEGLFKTVSESPEFWPVRVRVIQVPETESGEKFLKQFVGGSTQARAFPMTFTVPFKKARIMEQWAERVGAEIKQELSDAEI